MLKVTQVSPLANGKVYVVFNDGQKGEVDISPFMQSPFFLQLKDEAYFSKVSLFFGGIGWPDGQDLGPDTLAAALRPNTKIEKAS
ncbi:DUF2442 domain-containing protein [Nitrincola tapanii]|uniref:DUF2442 domain-containing protein n=1 Tax=Nitrincola tapanii TaxID=1708751 RepID=A0A5A9W5C0_9GAMM|nr:DUF2442 domain-containing protein [Nitrincola tapanii]KAA0875733.1 DUF2442 domain-containing protein [Nitrincola tapanii]